MCIGLIGSVIQHIENLPERNFERLKARERDFLELKATSQSATTRIHRSLFDRTIFGDLNYARFQKERGGVRRYYLYAAPHLALSAAASALAIPSLLIKTCFSSLFVFRNIFFKGWIEATDPALERIVDLTNAIVMLLQGVIGCIIKLAASIFRDTYKWYHEKREVRMNPKGNIALIGIDPQKTFVKGGNLAITDGEQIVEPAKKLMASRQKNDLVVLTQDWHSKNHKSFAVNSGLPVYSQAKLSGLDQILWPAHAMQGTKEAEFLDGLPLDTVDLVIRKGYDDEVDSYGAFWDNGKIHLTALHEILAGRNVKYLILFGLATDVCVYNTAMQAKELGYETCVVEEACMGVSMDSVAISKDKMLSAGIRIVSLSEVLVNGRLSFPSE